jgi:succinoglycan biosynthesis transport protein ExoP
VTEPLFQPQPDLKDYLATLRARKLVIIAVLVLVVASALAYSLTRTPIYESEARVQVRPVALSANSSFESGLNMETERQLASSITVAELAAKKLSTEEPPSQLAQKIDVSVETGTEILIFDFSDPSPKVAQEGAQAFADSYLEDRTRQANDDLVSVTEPIEDQLAELRDNLDSISDRLAASPSEADRLELEIRRDSLVGRIALLEDRLEGLTPATLEVGQIVQPAPLPTDPASPNHKLVLAMALVAGIALGIGSAFVAERFDDRLRGRRDLEVQSGVPVLAVVPAARSLRKQTAPTIVTVTDPDSVQAEAYRTLRTGILFDAASKSGTKVILITSPVAGEGKTTTTANLGVSLAQAGKRIILVSADLRRPRLHDFLGEINSRGLTNVLSGELSLSQALRRSPVGNLSFLPSGPVPANPAELLSSQRMRALLTELRNEADFVLIDTAPVLAVADSLTLAQLADAVLLIADADQTQRSAIEQAKEHLLRVNARLIGAVLNNFHPSKSRVYQPYSAYTGYASTNGDSEEQRFMRRRV